MTNKLKGVCLIIMGILVDYIDVDYFNALYTPLLEQISDNILNL